MLNENLYLVPTLILMIAIISIVTGALYLDYKNIFSFNKKKAYLLSLGFVDHGSYFERIRYDKKPILEITDFYIGNVVTDEIQYNDLKQMTYKQLISKYTQRGN